MSDMLEAAGRLAAAPLEGQGLDAAQAGELLELADRDLWAVLYHADRIRRRHRRDTVRLCGIVAAKVGRCAEDCKWCSQSARWPTGVTPRPLLADEELLAAARAAADRGVESFGLVTSGGGPTAEELDRLCGVIGQLRAEGRIAPCASLGALSPQAARKLAQAGCRRYNHNLETSRSFYPRVVTTHSYDSRLSTARAVKAAGMELCCGGLFGLGESWQDRIDLALELRGLDADTVPLNFLNPIPGTPLADAPRLAPLECLTIIALFRFMLPRQSIKVAGGREVNLRDLQSWIFHAGADGCILGNYLTTPGRPPEQDLKLLEDLELHPLPP